MPGSPFEIRPATRSDVPMIYRIAAVHDVQLEGPDGAGPPYIDRLFEDGTVLVAEREHTVVGFAAAVWLHAAGGGDGLARSHVSDLFVDPEAHGSGVGGSLLRALLAAHRDTRWTVSSSSDPRAQALYARAGIVPRWPLFYLQRPRTAWDRPLPPVRRAVVRRTSPEELSTALAELTGLDRGLDVRTWSSRRGGTPLRVEVDGRLALAGCVRDGDSSQVRWLDVAAIAPAADPLVALSATLASAEVFREDGSVGLCLGGPSPALRPLLDAGFRIVEHDTWGESEPGLVDPARFVPDPSVG